MEKILSYKSTALRDLLGIFELKITSIAKNTFGYTSNVTINRWKKGKDIYFTKLVHLCNINKIDMLSFLEFDGKPLRSTLMDDIALEEQGMSIRELMQKNKLEVVAKNTFMTLSPDFNQPYKLLVENKIEQSNKKEQSKEIAQSPEWFVNKTISILAEADEKKRIALEQQKNSMQQIIDQQNAIISELRKENKKLKSEIDTIIKKCLSECRQSVCNL